MNDEVLSIMEQRRQANKNDNHKYRQINNEIRKRIRQTKQEHFEDKCKEIEEHQNKYDLFNLHKLVGKMAGLQRKKHTAALMDKKRNTIMGTDEKLQPWREYIQESFEDERGELEQISIKAKGIGPEITKEKNTNTLKRAKNGKRTGPDELSIEILKIIEEKYIDFLVKFFNGIYR